MVEQNRKITEHNVVVILLSTALCDLFTPSASGIIAGFDLSEYLGDYSLRAPRRYRK